jgi:hypothetical protein
MFAGGPDAMLTGMDISGPQRMAPAGRPITERSPA